MLTEKNIPDDQIEIKSDGCLQIREANVIERDGVETSRSYHRYVLEPGADIKTRTDRIKAVAKLIWTKDVIANWKEKVRAEASPVAAPTL